MTGTGPGGRRHRSGPSITAIPFRHGETGLATPLLGEAERGRLALIATAVHFERGEVLHRQGDELTCVYNLVRGVVKTYSLSPDGRRMLTAFLFPGDLVGLAEDGRYTAAAEAVAPATAYRLPIGALERLLRQDPELELHFLCKVCHELREAQRHAVLLARRDAPGKVALFLHLLLNHDADGRGERAGGPTLGIPVSRADIADYAGLTIEAVSRSFGELERRGIIRRHGPHLVEIVDRDRFDRLLAGS